MTGFLRSGRSRSLLILAAAALLGTAPACGDDEQVPTDTGGGSDVSDMGGDDDAGDDVAPDGTEDLTEDAPGDTGGDVAEDTGGDGGGGDAGDDVDAGGDAGGDVAVDLPGEPPTYRQVLASILGELPSEADLARGDVTRIIPTTFAIEFKVFVQDDITATDELTVELVEGTEPPYTVVALDSNDFERGLWRPNTTVSPGQTLRVRTTDSDGHVAYSPGALIVPDLVTAALDTWEERQYDTGQNLLSSNDLIIEDGGDWGNDEDGDGEPEAGGTWVIEDGVLTLEVRFTPEDPDGTELLMELSAPYYVDETYFYHNPFTRTDGESELEGTWTREETLSSFEGESETVVNDYVSTLIINDDDTWSESWSGTIDGEEDATYTRSGTWEIVINENYTESTGDFLLRNVTSVNGEDLSEPEVLFELTVVRVGNLLVNPRIRKSE
jgi:hypothetical protein